jgi:hypothetical protein
MYNLALSYGQGSGVPADPIKAFSYFEKSANSGLPNAQRQVGLCCLNGVGVTKDPIAAIGWFRKAAKQGDIAAIANIGLAYRDGLGVDKDTVEAFAWLDLARFGTQQWQDDMKTKWGIRHELDELKKQMSPAQIKAGEARTKQLFEELRQ